MFNSGEKQKIMGNIREEGLEAVAEKNPKALDDFYKNLAFVSDNLKETFERREEQLEGENSENARMVLFEILMQHKEQLGKELSAMDYEISVTRGVSYQTTSHQYEKFMQKHGKDLSSGEWIPSELARVASKYGVLKLPEVTHGRLQRREMGLFCNKRDLGTISSEKEIAERTEDAIKSSMHDLGEQMENINKKLEVFRV